MNTTPTNEVQIKTDKLIFVEDFAEMIGRSPGAVRYMIHKGDGPPLRKTGWPQNGAPQ